MDVIEVSELKKDFGDFTAVDSISFSVKKGEVFAFLGPNGAGKTTTVEILVGLQAMTSGKVSILGKDIEEDKHKILERIGVLPQEFNTYDFLTVKENIDYFGRMYPRRLPPDEIIKLIDLEDKASVFFKNLSGGMKQRVGVAIALVNDPEVVFLDEPTAGLDPKARRGVWAVIEGLRRQGKTIFLTTHYMDEAQVLADTVTIINRGTIIASGSPDDLIEKYGDIGNLVLKDVGEIAYQKLSERFGGLGMKQVNGDTIIPLVERGVVVQVLSFMDEHEISYGEFTIKRSNLEDVFLNITGEEIHPGDVE